MKCMECLAIVDVFDTNENGEKLYTPCQCPGGGNRYRRVAYDRGKLIKNSVKLEVATAPRQEDVQIKKMRKIAINQRWGGFSLSPEAYRELGIPWDNHGMAFGDRRDDPDLIRVVEKLGEKSWGTVAKIKIVEVPMDVQCEINDYDGMETVVELHDSWS